MRSQAEYESHLGEDAIGSLSILPSTMTLPVAVVLGTASELTQETVARLSSGGSVVIMAPDAFTLHEWLAKVLNAHTDSDGVAVASFSRGDLTIDLGAHRALWRGQLLELTPTEFRLMTTLARQIGRAWSFRALMEDLWGPSQFGDAPLRSTVKRLRRKLVASGVEVVIESVRGVGYRLEDTTAPSLTPLD